MPASTSVRITPRQWFVPVLVTVLLAVSPLPAQTPLTADSLRSLLSQAGEMSRQLDRVDAANAPLQQTARQLIADFAKHNAELCEYPQGQPELCASYDMERHMLDARSEALQKSLRVVDAERRQLHRAFAALMDGIRVPDWAPQIAPVRGLMVACTNLDGMTAEASCLAKLLARVSPGARGNGQRAPTIMVPFRNYR